MKTKAMLKSELDYQIDKAVEFMRRGGDMKKWLESKDFTEEELNYIKNHPKIVEKLFKKE